MPTEPKTSTRTEPVHRPERCPSCNGVINPHTGECRCSE